MCALCLGAYNRITSGKSVLNNLLLSPALPNKGNVAGHLEFENFTVLGSYVE
jgi:hypothetical protein